MEFLDFFLHQVILHDVLEVTGVDYKQDRFQLNKREIREVINGKPHKVKQQVQLNRKSVSVLRGQGATFLSSY